MAWGLRFSQRLGVGLAQRVHVGIWCVYIHIYLGPNGLPLYILTLRPKYIPYSCMDPLGSV